MSINFFETLLSTVFVVIASLMVLALFIIKGLTDSIQKKKLKEAQSMNVELKLIRKELVKEGDEFND